MKVILFGAYGMMGRYAHAVLKNSCNVIPLGRGDFNIMELDNAARFLDTLNIEKDDVIVNCAGIINKRVPERGVRETVLVNALFPHVLHIYCTGHGAEFIHVSTDYVFSGIRGGYGESDTPDAPDEYGITKYIGEPERSTVIRTSFIGEERGQKRSLLEWVRSQKGVVPGYVDHRWNGITCLKLAEIVNEIITKRLFWKGVRHIYSPNVVSKYQLLKYINTVYKLKLTVEPYTAGYCDRSLISEHELIFTVSDIRDQIMEMKNMPAM